MSEISLGFVAPEILCPKCGGGPAIMYVQRRRDPRFPAFAVCECKACEGEWSQLLTPIELLGLVRSSPAPVDWGSECTLLPGGVGAEFL